MRKLLFIITIICCLYLIGCNNNIPEDMVGDLFNIPETEYYVFIYQDNCGACESAWPSVLKYNQKYTDNNDLIKIYTYNLSLEENKLIHRADPFKSGEGNDGKTKVDGAKSLEELYISSTPTLIKVILEEGEKKAYFCFSGRSAVVGFLDSLL